MQGSYGEQPNRPEAEKGGDGELIAPRRAQKSLVDTPAFNSKGSYGGHTDLNQYSGEEKNALHVSGSEQDSIIAGHVGKKSKFGDVHGGKGC